MGFRSPDVHVRAGETIYFQYVEAMSLVFEVADDQQQGVLTRSMYLACSAVRSDWRRSTDGRPLTNDARREVLPAQPQSTCGHSPGANARVRNAGARTRRT